MNERDTAFCPQCKKKYDRIDRIDVRDRFGIYYKGVCSEECAKAAESELNPNYINDDDTDCMTGW